MLINYIEINHKNLAIGYFIVVYLLNAHGRFYYKILSSVNLVDDTCFDDAYYMLVLP